MLGFFLHLGDVFCGGADELRVVCAPRSVDLVGVGALWTRFMAKMKTVCWSFCTLYPSSSRYGFSWLYFGVSGGGAVICWCFAPVVFAAC